MLKKSGRYFLIGFTMGSADVVPGVSGGTMALIMGVYETLIESIKSVDSKFVKLFFSGQIRKALDHINFWFLLPLGLGMITAILSLAKLISWLLMSYPEWVWSFFFGLVVASAVIVGRRVDKWSLRKLGLLVLGAGMAFVLSGLVPGETPATSLFFFLAGAIAICAMILPGLSGSFLLVVMGKYEQILNAVVTKDIQTIAIFMAGAVIGLALFSRVLSFMMKKHHAVMMAFLTGLMIGALRKIWPWKEIYGIEAGEAVYTNIWPAQFGWYEGVAVGLALVGLGLILGLVRVSHKKEGK